MKGIPPRDGWADPPHGGPREGLHEQIGRNITSCGQAAMRMISNHIVHK